MGIENSDYGVKSMIHDLSNMKDFASFSMKQNSYDIIKDILARASTEDESEDTKMAKDFADEFISAVTGIANDIVITADNKATDGQNLPVVVNQEDEVPEDFPDSDEEPYEYLEVIDEEDDSDEEKEEDKSKESEDEDAEKKEEDQPNKEEKEEDEDEVSDESDSGEKEEKEEDKQKKSIKESFQYELMKKMIK